MHTVIDVHAYTHLCTYTRIRIYAYARMRAYAYIKQAAQGLKVNVFKIERKYPG